MRFDIKLGNSYANVPRPSIGEVVAKINAQTRQSFQWLLILGATLLLSLLAVAIAPLWMAGIILITGLGILGLTLRDRQRQRMITLAYSLDHEMSLRFSAIQKACRVLSRAEKIWLEETRHEVQDRHKNAGASHAVNFNASLVKVEYVAPPLISTNLTVWSIQLSDFALFFLPDYILLWRRNLYSAISYSGLSIRFERERINLHGAIPKDARLTGQTWKNLHPDGTPEPTFGRNPRLVQVEYGLLNINASIGISIKLHVSNVAMAEQFVELFQSVQQWLATRTTDEATHTARDTNGQASELSGRYRKPAHEVLGVDPNASLAEIRAAYRRLAQMNHPDKVMGLAPEFRILAERRMKVITAAYKALSEGVRQRLQ